MIRTGLAALALWCCAAGPGAAQKAFCSDITHDDNRYTICEADAETMDLRLFLLDGAGAVLGQFTAVNDMLAEQGKVLGFAMNAGMYHADRRPVGYYKELDQQHQRIIPNPGPGNFGLLPNGIFCIQAGRADVIETLAFVARNPTCRYATQSGPMLVIDGALHPRFLPDSTSRYLRNGVGTSADGRRVVFAISRGRVNFDAFGRLFRDHLKLPNALYFDGNISRLHAPGLGRSDGGLVMGPIVGLVVED